MPGPFDDLLPGGSVGRAPRPVLPGPLFVDVWAQRACLDVYMAVEAAERAAREGGAHRRRQLLAAPWRWLWACLSGLVRHFGGGGAR